jgi:hypothetical protein
LHSLKEFLIEPLGAESRAAIPLNKLHTVAFEAAADAALAIPALVLPSY